jgi:hypothetical protein
MTTVPDASTTSTGTHTNAFPERSSFSRHRPTSLSPRSQVAVTRPDAGLRNLASSRRTTGTKPSNSPRLRASKFPRSRFGHGQQGAGVNRTQMVRISVILGKGNQSGTTGAPALQPYVTVER